MEPRESTIFTFPLPSAVFDCTAISPLNRLWGHARVNSDNDREYIIADIDVYDDSGNLVAEIYGFRADRVEQSDGEDLDKCVYEAQWEQALLAGTRIDGDNGLASPAEIVEAANENLEEYYGERGLHGPLLQIFTEAGQARLRVHRQRLSRVGLDAQIGRKSEG